MPISMSSNGIGYTLARTNIHSCDFSSGSYTYVTEGDKALQSFSVNHDQAISNSLHQTSAVPRLEGSSPSLAVPGVHRHS